MACCSRAVCVWTRNLGYSSSNVLGRPKTPIEHKDAQGYGPENASFASIILEATSVAFTMLLSHLKCKNSNFRSYRKRYGANFQPVETIERVPC